MKALAEDLARGGWQVRHSAEDEWLMRARHPYLGDINVTCVKEEYQRTALARSVERTVSGARTVRFVAVEDVIIHKLIVNRTEDELDVVSILKASPSLDAAHLEKWLKAWDVEERYQELRHRAQNERDADR